MSRPRTVSTELYNFFRPSFMKYIGIGVNLIIEPLPAVFLSSEPAYTLSNNENVLNAIEVVKPISKHLPLDDKYPNLVHKT